MLVVIDAKDAGEVTEIVTLLLTNKKNTFTVYNDETEMVRKVMKVELPIVPNQSDMLLTLKSTPEEGEEEENQEENEEEKEREELPPLPMEVLYPPIEIEVEEPKKKSKLDWNFSKQLPEIQKNMEDDSAYYIKMEEEEENYESSEEEECELVKYEKVEKKENKEKKEKKEKKKTGIVKLEIPRTALAPFEKKPKRGRPPKRDTPAVNMPEQDDYDNVICQKCKNNVRTISMNLRQLSSHAIVHTDLRRYACPIINCLFKGRQRSVVAYHIAKMHKMESKGVTIPDVLTDEEMERLEQCTLECFPNLTFD